MNRLRPYFSSMKSSRKIAVSVLAIAGGFAIATALEQMPLRADSPGADAHSTPARKHGKPKVAQARPKFRGPAATLRSEKDSERGSDVAGTATENLPKKKPDLGRGDVLKSGVYTADPYPLIVVVPALPEAVRNADRMRSSAPVDRVYSMQVITPEFTLTPKAP